MNTFNNHPSILYEIFIIFLLQEHTDYVSRYNIILNPRAKFKTQPLRSLYHLNVYYLIIS